MQLREGRSLWDVRAAVGRARAQNHRPRRRHIKVSHTGQNVTGARTRRGSQGGTYSHSWPFKFAGLPSSREQIDKQAQRPRHILTRVKSERVVPAPASSSRTSDQQHLEVAERKAKAFRSSRGAGAVGRSHQSARASGCSHGMEVPKEALGRAVNLLQAGRGRGKRLGSPAQLKWLLTLGRSLRSPGIRGRRAS